MSTAGVMILSPEHTYPNHPEEPQRFADLLNWELKPYASELIWLKTTPATIDEVTAIHTARMVKALEAACQRGAAIIDYAPTYVTRTSFQDALNAAGATLVCTRAVLEGLVHNAFALIRPPGHHAEPDSPMGFCLFNNVAIAARAALNSGIPRLLIVDFDAHHGNGTQAIFKNCEQVAYFSTHQVNIYPGSGSIDEAQHARGRIVNLPLPARAGDYSFSQIIDQVLIPLTKFFKPEMFFVSAGFDSHWGDPLTSLGLSSAGFYTYSKGLVELAEEYCGGKIVFVLEGGYNSRNVASGVDAVFSALTKIAFSTQDKSPYPDPDISSHLKKLQQLHGLGKT